MDHNRRKFLKGVGTLASSMLLPMQFSTTNVHAAVTGNKKLVILTLNGGNDGLNTVIPLTQSQYDLYAGYRPTIKIPQNLVIPFNPAVNETGIDFGLHPSLAALVTPQNVDKLAVFPATHSSANGFNANTSHFYQMDLFARGVTGESPQISSVAADKGWIGRYLDGRYANQFVPSNSIIAQDFTAGIQRNVRGNLFTLDLSNPANLGFGVSESASEAIRADTKYISGAEAGTSAGKYNNTQSVLFEEVLANLKSNVIFRPTSNNYPAGGFGNQFRQVADMLIGLPELEVVHLAQGGYDTHQNQVVEGDSVTGKQAGLLKGWADSIAAFYDDLRAVDAASGSSLSSDVIVVVQTEFGRTVDENENFGTDHGHASCWIAFGDSVQGGLYGGYDGLEQSNLNKGGGRFWLKPKTDYRDIYSRLIGSHLGYNSPGDAFPGSYDYSANTLNFLA